MGRTEGDATAFVFDVDGTLVASALNLTDEHRDILERFCQNRSVYLTSGAAFEKTCRQIGDLVFAPRDGGVRGIFNCNGNSFHVGGSLVFESFFDLSNELAAYLDELLGSSEFPLRTGRHVEQRSGLVNFSVVGRNADLAARRQYVEWDRETRERERFARLINRRFGDVVTAQVAGETGLDLVEPGSDKGRIYGFLKSPYRCSRTGYAHEGFERIVFFGDNCLPGGNDYPLAKQLDPRIDVCHRVNTIDDTYTELKRILSGDI